MKIGIDIGGSHIAIAKVDSKGNIIEKVEQDIGKQENVAQYILNYVDNTIETFMKTGNIKEIGIASPGNPKGTVVGNLVNLQLSELDFKEIAEKYDVTIKTINDAKAAAMAEKAYGAIQDSRDCVFLCLGTGIGGAVFLHNKLLKANRNPGFELGHMVIERNGLECSCGKKGCFETYCSMKRLKERVKKILERIDSKGANLHGEELKEQLKRNLDNLEIQKLIEEYIDNLVIGLSNVIDIFEPETICLGGSFVYFEDILYKPLILEMEKRRYVFNKECLPKIVLAKLQNDAGIIGATLI